MAAAATHDAPASSRRDLIARVLDSLVAERQRLRATRTDPALLEANRLAIVYWQNELVREIGEQHARRADAPA